MLQAGALEEVAALASRKLDPLLPAMKAHGVPALIRHLAGEISLDEAAEIGRADTRHYAKRQFTWFRHQLPEFEWVRPEAAREWLTTVIPRRRGTERTAANPGCARASQITQAAHSRAPGMTGPAAHGWNQQIALAGGKKPR